MCPLPLAHLPGLHDPASKKRLLPSLPYPASHEKNFFPVRLTRRAKNKNSSRFTLPGQLAKNKKSSTRYSQGHPPNFSAPWQCPRDFILQISAFDARQRYLPFCGTSVLK
jgi:hypothetical protein